MSDGDARPARTILEDNTNDNVDDWKSCHSGPWKYCEYTETLGPPENNRYAPYEEWVIIHEDEPHDAHSYEGAYWGCGGVPGMLKPLSVEIATGIHEYQKWYLEDSRERLDSAVNAYGNNMRNSTYAAVILGRAITNAKEQDDV